MKGLPSTHLIFSSWVAMISPRPRAPGYPVHLATQQVSENRGDDNLSPRSFEVQAFRLAVRQSRESPP